MAEVRTHRLGKKGLGSPHGGSNYDRYGEEDEEEDSGWILSSHSRHSVFSTGSSGGCSTGRARNSSGAPSPTSALTHVGLVTRTSTDGIGNDDSFPTQTSEAVDASDWSLGWTRPSWNFYRKLRGPSKRETRRAHK